MRVLQIGRDDWSASCRVPAGVEWAFVSAEGEPGATGAGETADVTILDAPCDPRVLAAVDALVVPHTLLVARGLAGGLGDDHARFLARKAAVDQDVDDRQGLVDELPQRYFEGQPGRKLGIRRTLVAPAFAAAARYEGGTALVVDVDHDGDFRQLMVWKDDLRYEGGQAIELWPEYTKEAGCELELVVQLVRSGAPDVIAVQRGYSEAELAEPIVFSHPESGYLSCSFFARGTGRVRIGPLHSRRSRRGAGWFLPGGRRIVDSRREELFSYFHPGDLTPPLGVHFAGYRPAEGFEGQAMMAGLGHPFLLLADPRLEGGRFYLGSEELEERLRQEIRDRIDALGFREEDVIFSGLSMGSLGALYYGSQFRAHAIIAGKPILDLGRVAERARLVRPRDFLTVLDIVNFWNGAGAPNADAFTRELVERWRGDPGFGQTRVLMSYMEQDDYDDEAVYALLGSQAGKPTTVIARGYQGRHDDDNVAVVTWFLNQYRRVIDEFAGSR